jgi:uncharacterized protein
LVTVAADTPADTFAYDPRDPVPSVGGRTLSPVFGSAGVQDQRRVAEREDVLVYTGAPLEAEIVVAGRARLALHATTDCPGTDFTGKVVDVEPDGYCRNVAEGIVRLRRPPSGAITIDLQAIGHTFRAGHRVRVEVASSLFPHYARNLNGPDRPEHGGVGDIRIARQTVRHDADHPSHLVLPVLTGAEKCSAMSVCSAM